MSETLKEAIEQLKKNDRTIYADMSREDKGILTDLGLRYCERLSCNPINLLFWDEPYSHDDRFIGTSIYRIRPDYQPEPKYDNCTVIRKGNGLKYLSPTGKEEFIGNAVDNVDFAGFFFCDDGPVEVPLEWVARRIAEGKTVVAHFKKVANRK